MKQSLQTTGNRVRRKISPKRGFFVFHHDTAFQTVFLKREQQLSGEDICRLRDSWKRNAEWGLSRWEGYRAGESQLHCCLLKECPWVAVLLCIGIFGQDHLCGTDSQLGGGEICGPGPSLPAPGTGPAPLVAAGPWSTKRKKMMFSNHKYGKVAFRHFILEQIIQECIRSASAICP